MINRNSSNTRIDPVSSIGHRLQAGHIIQSPWVLCERPNFTCTARDLEVAGLHFSGKI